MSTTAACLWKRNQQWSFDRLYYSDLFVYCFSTIESNVNWRPAQIDRKLLYKGQTEVIDSLNFDGVKRVKHIGRFTVKSRHLYWTRILCLLSKWYLLSTITWMFRMKPFTNWLSLRSFSDLTMSRRQFSQFTFGYYDPYPWKSSIFFTYGSTEDAS